MKKCSVGNGKAKRPGEYEFMPSAATPTLILFDVCREVPYFYNTFGSLTFGLCCNL